MRGKAVLQEAALIVTNVRPELAITRELLTMTALVPFGCEEIVIKREYRSAGKLVVPMIPVETLDSEQGPSRSRKIEEREDEEKEDRQLEEAMEQDPGQVRRDDDKASEGGASRLDFNL